MALARGIYGIEYNPRQPKDNSGGLGALVVVVVLVALGSLVWTAGVRIYDWATARSAEEAVPEVATAAEVAVATNAPPAELPAALAEALRTGREKRPVKLRNLLMRLEAAERQGDVELAVTTIESIRQLSGEPAADIDDVLARRLGELNLRRLYALRSAQWVARITVKSGAIASRIAAEQGSTLASMERLNGGSVDRLVTGRTVFVMNHPRFRLSVQRRTRIADLYLNGKFFCRFDLTADVTGKIGQYETRAPFRKFLAALGIVLSPKDRTELEILMPAGSPVLISEM